MEYVVIINDSVEKSSSFLPSVFANLDSCAEDDEGGVCGGKTYGWPYCQSKMVCKTVGGIFGSSIIWEPPLE